MSIIKAVKLLSGIIVLCLVVFYAADYEQYLHAFSRVSIFSLLIAFLVGSVDRFIMAWKWNMLLGVLCQTLPFLRSVQIYCSAQLYGFFLPATIGTDAIRIAYTVAENRNFTDVTASVVIERVFGILATLSTCLVALFFSGFLVSDIVGFVSAFWIVLSLLIIVSSLTFISLNNRTYDFFRDYVFKRKRNNKIISFLNRLHSSCREYKKSPNSLLVFFIYTVLEVLSGSLFIYVLLLGLNVDIDYTFVVAVYNLAALLGRIPISISGLGVFEAGFVYFLSLKGVPAESAVLVGVMSRLLQILVWIPWWASYINTPLSSSRS